MIHMEFPAWAVFPLMAMLAIAATLGTANWVLEIYAFFLRRRLERASLIGQRVRYDEEEDLIIVDGVRFTPDALTVLTHTTPPGKAFRVERSKNGVVTVFEVTYHEPPKPILQPSTETRQ